MIYLNRMNYTCFNGKILPSDQPVLHASNRGYRYGDGLFETMKILRDKIILEDLHFKRFYSGLQFLKIGLPSTVTADRLMDEIKTLCGKNKCGELARVRLSVSRGDGGLYEGGTKPDYVIECWPLDVSANMLNENGLVVDIFPDSRKSIDKFSGLKSASFQPYVMAALFAKEQKLNDCLLLNSADRIADSTIANLFLVMDGRISTPALSEGCVAGVMRDHLITALGREGQLVSETAISGDDLTAADEVFLTNAIKGIRWVRQCRKKSYTNQLTVKIYDQFVKTLLI